MGKKDNQAPRIQSLQALVDKLHIPDWDVLLVGDGSGVGWEHPVGCAAVLIDRVSGQRKMFAAGLNTGTISIAEMLPYVLALNWYVSNHGPHKQRIAAAVPGKPLQIHIVTDSEYVANAGNFPVQRKAHRPIWAAFNAVASMGYAITFHHIGRNRVDLNSWADVVAGKARELMLEFDVSAMERFCSKYDLPVGVRVEDINP